MLVTRAALESFTPTAKPELLQAILDNWGSAKAAGITTPLRVQHFLTQIATETGGFRILEENLNYTAKRMMEVWPRRFPTIVSTEPYARNPEKLANKVYSDRLGNSSPSSGDGWKYRGRGFIQTTGKANYQAAGHLADPETLAKPNAGFAAAVRFWTDRGCNAIADKDDLDALRLRINGGTTGIAEARRYLAKAKTRFVDVEPKPIPAPIPKPVEPIPPPAVPTPDPRPTPPVAPRAPRKGNWLVAAAIILGGAIWFLWDKISALWGG